MLKRRLEDLPASLFRKTGLLLACIASAYLMIFLVARIFGIVLPETYRLGTPLLITVGASATLFALSALYDSLNWLQPVTLFVLTPLSMLHHASSMLSLGTFIAAEILLYRLGFFEHKKLAKFLLSIVYFYLCEILIGLASGTSAFEIVMPILFMTIFLGFLMIIYGDKWVIYLKEPKPFLSLAALGITRKEAEYLRSLISGKSIKEIAIDDGVKDSTVRNTLARVYKKFNVADKSALMAKCENYSIIE